MLFESFDGWNLDRAAACADYQTHFQVLEGLLRFGADGESFEPGLAEDWVRDADALTWTFTLRENAVFSKLDLARKDLGLNDPVFVQYGRYVGNVLQGDLGCSSTATAISRVEVP